MGNLDEFGWIDEARNEFVDSLDKAQFVHNKNARNEQIDEAHYRFTQSLISHIQSHYISKDRVREVVDSVFDGERFMHATEDGDRFDYEEAEAELKSELLGEEE